VQLNRPNVSCEDPVVSAKVNVNVFTNILNIKTDSVSTISQESDEDKNEIEHL
jgi:hypothetical protein